MKGATLLLGQREREALHRLRDQATKAPVNITGLEERIDAPGGKAAYTRQVSAQTVMIRMDFLVTFWIETGHPRDLTRHLTMSET